MKYQGKLDKECKDLCDAMNMIPGIRTISSCCGHDKTPYNIWFKADNLKVLPKLLYYFDSCHCGFCGWRIFVSTDCGMSPATFCVEALTDLFLVYEQSKYIAKLLMKEAQIKEK